jgi:hypothetical protein
MRLPEWHHDVMAEEKQGVPVRLPLPLPLPLPLYSKLLLAAYSQQNP